MWSLFSLSLDSHHSYSLHQACGGVWLNTGSPLCLWSALCVVLSVNITGELWWAQPISCTSWECIQIAHEFNPRSCLRLRVLNAPMRNSLTMPADQPIVLLRSFLGINHLSAFFMLTRVNTGPWFKCRGAMDISSVAVLKFRILFWVEGSWRNIRVN